MRYLCILLLFVAGCGGPRVHRVHGKVTLDGTPVPNAQITFHPSDPKLGADAGRTDKDGAYSFDVKPGKHTVKIDAFKKVPAPKGTKGASGETITHNDVNFIPDKFNTKSTLQADINGPKEQDFVLTTK